MVWKSKKTFLVSVSVVFGVLVVLSAAKMAGFLGTNTPSASNDSEWESALSIIPEMATFTRVGRGNIQTESSLVATTTTELVSRKLIVEYALSQKDTTSSVMSEAEATKIASLLAQEVKLPQKKEYALSDLNISKDNGETAGTLYKNTLNTLIQGHMATEQKESELSILNIAMSTKSQPTLDKLDAKIDLFENLIEDLLSLKTPSSVASIHLHLLQGYETLRSATVGFKSILTDPVVGIAALAEYRNGMDALLLAEKEYRDFNVANQ